MKFRFPQVPANGSGHKWRHRRPSGETATADSTAAMPELLAAACSATQRNNLSPGARRLFNAINRNEYVICIDPRTMAALADVSEQKLPLCLNELRRAGMISTWIGNLVFFD
ncbi:MAG: hypothetical protein ACYDCO_24385 [Armatimonadota bacterium]